MPQNSEFLCLHPHCVPVSPVPTHCLYCDIFQRLCNAVHTGCTHPLEIFYYKVYKQRLYLCTSDIYSRSFFHHFFTFTGPCIVNIYSSTTNKMQRYTMVFITIIALHVSGGSTAHHQELKTVHTASGICRAISASYRYRGWVVTPSHPW
jgi:hypothetical protein